MSWSIVLMVCINALAQKSIPWVDSKGHIHYNNKEIGTLTAVAGLDKSGHPTTKIDNSGNVIDSTGNIIGRAPKNNTFEYYMNDKAQTFSIGTADHSGLCEVKNDKGKVILLLHQGYKAQAACAIHCLYDNHCMSSQMEHVQ
ncbi:MAG: hypothetical protein ABI761_12055 [Saprospiraceae bacterium]